ncbi:MAG: hypothetical protein QME77_08780 [bacterium]|nr:hypothetical protein [bacterium]
MAAYQLYDLQLLDTSIVRTAAHRASLDDGTAQRAVVAATVQELADLQGRLAAWHAHLRALDLEIRSVGAKRAKFDADLYSGRVGNPKELAAIQEEIGSLDRLKGSLEDEALSVMEQVEQVEPEARRVEAALEASQAALTHQEAAFIAATAAADGEIADLTARRSALAAQIDEYLLKRYERLREHKGGLAVVAVTGGICDGCHVAIPEGRLQRIAEDPNALAACDGCGRLLVVRGVQV